MNARDVNGMSALHTASLAIADEFLKCPQLDHNIEVCFDFTPLSNRSCDLLPIFNSKVFKESFHRYLGLSLSTINSICRGSSHGVGIFIFMFELIFGREALDGAS